jgi:hypothetical protein
MLCLRPLILCSALVGCDPATDKYCDDEKGGSKIETKMKIEREGDGEVVLRSRADEVTYEGYAHGYSSCDKREVGRKNISKQEIPMEILLCTIGDDVRVSGRSLASGKSLQLQVPAAGSQLLIAWRVRDQGPCDPDFYEFVSGKKQLTYTNNEECQKEFYAFFKPSERPKTTQENCSWRR